jgi:hypothetical protein
MLPLKLEVWVGKVAERHGNGEELSSPQIATRLEENMSKSTKLTVM